MPLQRPHEAVNFHELSHEYSEPFLSARDALRDKIIDDRPEAIGIPRRQTGWDLWQHKPRALSQQHQEVAAGQERYAARRSLPRLCMRELDIARLRPVQDDEWPSLEPQGNEEAPTAAIALGYSHMVCKSCSESMRRCCCRGPC